ncbi:hypothetical protein [Demequina capsici]|uniref:Uncharacterized protein n=1 Tax=Demequina capsici TaxID=3075620 RepID=A0AA96F7T4_9MICO|nr:hypothetical protein [Demequina sp. OYTSA14]WNM24392.1 hypothetical protein RN606_13665 [Demequina sp. OYTSA14]
MEAATNRGDRVVVGAIRVVASVEAIDALTFLATSGWLGANPWLIALTLGGLVGVAVAWISRRTIGLVAGAVLVAIAPVIVYPLSALLLALALTLVVMRAVRAGRARLAASSALA